MTRILVTGNAGSGKTTLARRLAEALDLPLFGLDTVVWRPGWTYAPREEREAAYAALIARPAWVVDGVSTAILQAADVVVFLDVPRRLSFARCARRNWPYLFRSRPGLPERCPEILIVPTLARIIWNFPAQVRPGILAAMAAHEGRAYVVRTQNDLEAVVAALTSAVRAT